MKNFYYTEWKQAEKTGNNEYALACKDKYREIVKNVKDSATLYTDEWLGYNGLKRIYDHSIVKHNQGQYVNGRVHTNTIEGFWSLLKRGIFGIYHFTSKKHLQKYVDEFVFRYNTRQISDSFRFQFYLSNCQGRLSYQDLIKV